MTLSLHLQLQGLTKQGVVEVRPTSPRHKLAGEGSFFHNGSLVKIASGFLKQNRPDEPDTTFEVPHDIAWNSKTKEVLAFAPTDSGNPPGATEPVMDDL